MKTDNRRRSQELARALNLAVARAPQLQSGEVVAALNEIEGRFLPKVSTSTKEQLETKRRVAEWKFKLLSERNLPFEEVEKFYRRCGSSDLRTWRPKEP